jgi:hypothetical protein
MSEMPAVVAGCVLGGGEDGRRLSREAVSCSGGGELFW